MEPVDPWPAAQKTGGSIPATAAQSAVSVTGRSRVHHNNLDSNQSEQARTWWGIDGPDRTASWSTGRYRLVYGGRTDASTTW